MREVRRKWGLPRVDRNHRKMGSQNRSQDCCDNRKAGSAKSAIALARGICGGFRMTKGQRVWDTMKQAAAAMALPLSILTKAKSAGCDAFVGSRIYEDKLAP